MITGISELKPLTKYVSWSVHVNLMEENLIQIDGRITINIDWGAKKWHVCAKDYVWNPATCSYKNRKYLASIMED